MKKPLVLTENVSLPTAKLIIKLQKENLPYCHKYQIMDPLQLVRTAAHQQQMRVAQLIQEINK
jgi:hypothetical protein